MIYIFVACKSLSVQHILLYVTKPRHSMRLHLKLSANSQPVNFNHLPVLAGALHKWLGPNSEHDGLSLYSFSWLQGARPGFFLTINFSKKFLLCDKSAKHEK